MRLQTLVWTVAVACAGQPAFAVWNDRIELFVDETLTRDSNVFRLSRDVNPLAPPVPSEHADWLSVTSLGITADVPYSLQRFQAGYTWYATRYHRFDYLNFNGHIARANWLWAITPHVTGDIGATETRSLANFATTRATTRDLVTQRQGYANGNVELTPSFILYGGISRVEREYDEPTRRINDVRIDAEEVRLSYQNAAENRIGVSFRHEEGKSPERQFGGIAFNNGYNQDGFGAVGRWQVSGLSRFEGRVDYVKREYAQFRERNYRGPSARVTWIYLPTGKVTLTSSIYREIAPIDEVQTSFVLATGVSVRPRWDVTSKIAVLGTLDYVRSDYRNALPVLPGTTTPSLIPDRYDQRVRTVGASIVWRPFTRVLLQAGVLREVRSSDLPFADYTANVVSIEGRIGF